MTNFVKILSTEQLKEKLDEYERRYTRATHRVNRDAYRGMINDIKRELKRRITK